MSLPVALGLYFICWWLVFFAVLPFGVHTQADAGRVEEGTAESAPVAPRILTKVLVTTLVSAVVYAIIYAVINFHLIPLDEFLKSP
jgi:predicted secreted protein